MTYPISEIARILKTDAPAFPDLKISVLLTDSRSVSQPSESLFFAMTTLTNDGHRYIPELYAAGVRNFVVTTLPDACYPGANFLKVRNSLSALQEIAKAHRSRFNIPVIGITGSRGKTTVKEWLFHLLHDDFRLARSPRSYNSRIGVPLSVWKIDSATEIAVIEAGISQPDEMQALERIIKPTIGIITNIGDCHDNGFASRRDKCREKMSLITDADCVIYNGDDPLITEVAAESRLPAKEIAWSRRDRNCPLLIKRTTREHDSTTIDYSYLNVDGQIRIPFTDDTAIENAIHCLAVMLYLNRPAEAISAGMLTLPKVDTRLEVIDATNNCQMVHDAYTGDFNSLAPALDFMQRRVTRPRTMTVILSDLLHESNSGDSLYPAVADLLKRYNVTRLIGIGPEIGACADAFHGLNARFFASTAELLASITPADFHNEFILVKGADRFHLGKICDMLESRQHETVLEVNLDAITHNYNFFRSHLRSTTGIVCMVKAFGYGAGSYELAKTLQSQGAAYLAVAAHDEGVDLRENGITMPIMVLNPKVVNYRALFAYHLEPEIYSLEMLHQIIDEGRKWGVRDYPVHIKLDTGMHRLGFV